MGGGSGFAGEAFAKFVQRILILKRTRFAPSFGEDVNCQRKGADMSLHSLEAQQLSVLLYNGLPQQAGFAAP